MRDKVQLAAYADRFGGSVTGLTELLRTKLAGVYGGVRLLSSGARGQAPAQTSGQAPSVSPAGAVSDAVTGDTDAVTGDTDGASPVVYDHPLASLLLHALIDGDAAPLARWLAVRPTGIVSVLDTQDGIVTGRAPKKAGAADGGAIDFYSGHNGVHDGFLPQRDVDRLVRAVVRNTHGESALFGPADQDGRYRLIDSTYYSALGCDDTKYLAARAVQFFLPGLPEVYYMGAMMAPNDLDLPKKTGTCRDINRHIFAPAEIGANLLRPEVKALNALCRFRNSLEAFGGDFTYGYDDTYGVLGLVWQGASTSARLDFDARVIADRREMGQGGMDPDDLSWRSVATITWTDAAGEHKTNDLLGRPPVVAE